jgi:hypothetical protein
MFQESVETGPPIHIGLGSPNTRLLLSQVWEILMSALSPRPGSENLKYGPNSRHSSG